MMEKRKRGRPRTKPDPAPSQTITVLGADKRVIAKHQNVPGSWTLADIRGRMGIASHLEVVRDPA